MAIAVYGFSHVVRMETYIRTPSHLELYGDEEISASQPCFDLFLQMIADKPRIIVFCLGGKDLAEGVNHDVVYQRLVTMVQLVKPIVEEVYIVEMFPRRSPGAEDPQGYEAERTSLNRMLQMRYPSHFLQFGLEAKRDTCADGVHLGPTNYWRIIEKIEELSELPCS